MFILDRGRSTYHVDYADQPLGFSKFLIFCIISEIYDLYCVNSYTYTYEFTQYKSCISEIIKQIKNLKNLSGGSI